VDEGDAPTVSEAEGSDVPPALRDPLTVEDGEAPELKLAVCGCDSEPLTEPLAETDEDEEGEAPALKLAVDEAPKLWLAVPLRVPESEAELLKAGAKPLL